MVSRASGAVQVFEKAPAIPPEMASLAVWPIFLMRRSPEMSSNPEAWLLALGMPSLCPVPDAEPAPKDEAATEPAPSAAVPAAGAVVTSLAPVCLL